MSRQVKTNLKNWFIRVFLLFAFVMLLSVKLLIHFKVDLLMQDIRALEVKRNQLLSEREHMISEVNRLKNIDRITKIAEQKLGLVTDPEPVYSIKLEDYQRFHQVQQAFARKQHQQKNAFQVAGIK